MITEQISIYKMMIDISDWQVFTSEMLGLIYQGKDII